MWHEAHFDDWFEFVIRLVCLLCMAKSTRHIKWTTNKHRHRLCKCLLGWGDEYKWTTRLEEEKRICLNYYGSPIIPALAGANLHCEGWASSSHCHVHVPIKPETLKSRSTKFEDLCHSNFSSWKVKQQPRPLTFEVTTRLGRKTHCAMFDPKKWENGKIRSDNQTSVAAWLGCWDVRLVGALLSFVWLH